MQRMFHEIYYKFRIFKANVLVIVLEKKNFLFHVSYTLYNIAYHVKFIFEIFC